MTRAVRVLPGLGGRSATGGPRGHEGGTELIGGMTRVPCRPPLRGGAVLVRLDVLATVFSRLSPVELQHVPAGSGIAPCGSG
jgi:hypothetical protein